MDTEQNIPIYSRRKKSSKRKSKRLLILIIIFFILISLGIYFQSPLSKILDIKVKGHNLLTEQEILEAANINLNMQYLFVSTSSIEKKLVKLDEVKTVNVSKEFPGKLIINIEENQPIAFIYNENNELEPILENGSIYHGKKLVYPNRPLITKWYNKEKLAELIDQLKEVETTVLTDISEIQQNPQQDSPNQLLIYSNEGYRIHISLSDLGKKLNLYPSIIKGLKEKNPHPGDIYMLETMRFQEY